MNDSDHSPDPGADVRQAFGRSVRTVGVRDLAAVLALSGCHREPVKPVELHVSAAVSLREPLEDLARRYERDHRAVRVRFAFGASGDLATQIERGAPVSLFASAASDPVERLRRTARLNVLCTLAGNELVLVRQRDARLDDLGWENLATHPGVQRVALGVAPTVPAGVYAERALTSLGAMDALRPKVVRGGNVRQVLDLVARGEAEAGVVYATDVRGRSDVVVVGPPPPSARPTVRYPLAWMAAAEHGPEARALGAFLCGPDGRRVFDAHGFTAP